MTAQDDPSSPAAPPAKTPNGLLIVWPILASLFSLAGVVAFVLLFVPRMTVFWFILSPLIIIVYQFPAFVILRMWRRKKARPEPRDETGEGDVEKPAQNEAGAGSSEEPPADGEPPQPPRE